MSTRRALLDALADGPVSGPDLAADLDVSRAAVWKAVESLREEGFAIESTTEGYVAPAEPPYSAAGIAFGLDAPYRIDYHDVVDSTNARARALAAAGEADVAVVAGEQRAGRGRVHRDWVSPTGGVWTSVLTRPVFPTAHAPAVTLAAAVATTDACREAGVDAHIKWPNDVLVGDTGERGGRKLSGILTEMEGEADRITWLIVGIGVNANVDPDRLPAGATSLWAERGEKIDRRRFLQRVLERYHRLTAEPDRILEAWRDRTSTLGSRVRVETGDAAVEGTAIGVEFPGTLVVLTDDGEHRRIHTGDCEHLRPAGE
ncbi:biotin--[acetyl-CoA-carboxylase] ligase [Halorubrum vacuolatum]|uniref:BirA family transcriptional regulator, biotin operon repressor / biotin-[acetyl-CoA-carboxylase] ligase n=1 Tax=Halorubrum vacuolatum TaxID=63740 RepID=A0A238XZL8_HALVU|nr:biotin--[acetyl-CoA-carboxylase] ligase [Halorubrum vacuolatum]SNR64337.1 BirA family transcriptional regulator, biotin operon repressor / biotin-[acetyl-CoA-carboxylase] ligase [Halorubrum vacuolatum]